MSWLNWFKNLDGDMALSDVMKNLPEKNRQGLSDLLHEMARRDSRFKAIAYSLTNGGGMSLGRERPVNVSDFRAMMEKYGTTDDFVRFEKWAGIGVFGSRKDKGVIHTPLAPGQWNSQLMDLTVQEAVSQSVRGGVKPLGTVRGSDGKTYRVYHDETLNSRMKDPTMKGSTLEVTIDGEPKTVKITSASTLEAYRAGALPLNTLANAVLRQLDAAVSSVQQNFELNQGRDASLSQSPRINR